MGLIKLVTLADNESVYVNVDQIRAVYPDNLAEGVKIVFEREHSITVAGDLENVAADIDKLMRR